MWGSGCCQMRLSFAASQVGWFPSTYVEEEDWRHFSACSKLTPPPPPLSASCETVLPGKKPETLTEWKRWPPTPTSPKKIPLILPSRRTDVKSHVPGASRHISPLHGPGSPSGLSGKSLPPLVSISSFPLTLHYIPRHQTYVVTDAADITARGYSWKKKTQKNRAQKGFFFSKRLLRLLLIFLIFNLWIDARDI